MANAKPLRILPTRFVLPSCAVGLLALGIGLAALMPTQTVTTLVLRWAGIALLAAYAAARRSVTPWIVFAMIAGAEIGFDAPAFAIHLRVFSDIFLRLIKTIVAPLILVTLVTGIAGHGDLKGVGRMGLRSLIYFEVVTTLALAIGLVAINLSHAGVGLTLPVGAHEAVATPPALHWDDFLLHIFPENIAKSISEGADSAGGRLRCAVWDSAGYAA